VLYALNGTCLRGYEQINMGPFEEFDLIAEKRPKVVAYIENLLSLLEKERLAQVGLLIEGYESPYSLINPARED
jgi:hypothetical protein